MKEAEWQTCADPGPMIRTLSTVRHQRELRLFVLACVRRVWHLLPSESRAVVELAQRMAGDRSSIDELRVALAAAVGVAQAHWSGGRVPDARAYAESAAIDASSEWPRTAENVLAVTSCAASAMACAVADGHPDGDYDRAYGAARTTELAAQAELLRSIIGALPE